jgi:hypothetical protein
MMANDFTAFVTESNRIEGITRAPTKAEIAAHEAFLDCQLSVAEIEAFVAIVAPGKRLRDQPGMDVRVGDHIAPPGGQAIRLGLQSILADARSFADPWRTHVAYEHLHPFMDGNGRSGRALWLWQMLQLDDPHVLRRGFLHTFYYQTLSRMRP